MSDEMKCPVPHGANPATATETASPMHGAVTHTSRKIVRNCGVVAGPAGARDPAPEHEAG